MTRRLLVTVCVAAFVFGIAGHAGAQSILYAAAQDAPDSTISVLYTVNPSSGVMTRVGPISNFNYVYIAIHPLTGVIYGVASGDLFNTLIRIDPVTAAGTAIGTLMDPTGAACGSTPCYVSPQDLTFTPDGTLIGWQGGHGGYFTIDVTTGNATLVPFETNFHPGISPMAVGPDGVGYGAWSEPNLMRIDLTTGEVNGPLLSLPDLPCGESLFRFSTLAFESGSGTLFGTMAAGGAGDPFESDPCLVRFDRTDPDSPIVTAIGLMPVSGVGGQGLRPWINTLAWSPAPAGNTPAGVNVTVTLAAGVSVTFSDVERPGETSVSVEASGPALPGGFMFAGTSAYYEIATTAQFTGVAVCIDTAGLGISGAPHLFHYTGGAWQDVLPIATGSTPTTVCGTVTSLSPFALLVPVPSNHAPVARAGDDQTLECCAAAGTPITLDGSASSDQDHDALAFRWTDSTGRVIGTAAVVHVTAGRGTHVFTLTVTDPSGAFAIDDMTVVVIDSTAPVIRRIVATPDVLWPPRDRMVPVSIRVDVSDACDADVRCRIAAVSSDADPVRHGHDRLQPDWRITGALSLELRAERSGRERERSYRIVIECADASGHTARKIVVVDVPHDRR